jgi:hypothetical protein
LPGGLTLNATTGAITGTPTTANTFTFTVKATNAKGNYTKSLSITIVPVFNSISAFKTWLDAQSVNTAATAYSVKVNIADLGGTVYDTGSLGTALYTNRSPAKYVNLDLSGSTFTSIEGSAFYECTNLTAINVDSANSAYTSENGVLYNKAKTTLVQYPAGKTGAFTIPAGVTSIGDRAFHSYSLTNVTIPAGVTTIGDFAFIYCTSLTSVTFAVGSNIPYGNFGTFAFPEGSAGTGGNTLKTAYNTGKAGTYTRPNTSSTTWTKS